MSEGISLYRDAFSVFNESKPCGLATIFTESTLCGLVTKRGNNNSGGESGKIKMIAKASEDIPSGSAFLSFKKEYTYAYGDNWIIE